MLKGFTRKFKPLEILTEGQVDAIWKGILDVLEKPGLKFDVGTPKALKIFDKAGCKVDYDTKMVRFPQDLVTECLSKCSSNFRLKAREPKNDIVIGGDKVYVHPGPGLQYLDIDTFEPRVTTRKEFYGAVTVYDALPNLHFFQGLSPNSLFEGIPPAMGQLETLVARVRNSTKANGGSSLVSGDYFHIEVAKVVGINILWAVGAAPPLTWSDHMIDGAIAATEAGFPLTISSGAIWGASSPATIAGAMISCSAEVMGPVILSQLIHLGHPLTVKLFAMPQNMRTGGPFFGNIAIALGNAAFSQVWRRYNIPTTGFEAGIPNSKCMDFQSGYEKGMLALAAAICGAHVLLIHGTVYGELTAHPIQAIMDDDISGMVGHFLEGIEVNDETLAVELIKQVGSGPDFYLNKEHTRKWWQKEQFIPAVADTSPLPVWLKEGKKTTIDLAKEKMEEILATHKVPPLTTGQEEEIERILAEARKFFKKKGKL